MADLVPTNEAELCEAIAQAAAAGEPLEIQGGASKANIGAPRAPRILSMASFTGIIDYDPAELVLTLRAGTPLAEAEALVAAQGQMLAFEPFDHGPMLGKPAGKATIGGVIAAGVAGSRRISAGAARDHVLGLRAVSGRGELFVGGAKVVKNVTGYDLPKLLAGSWGRLGAMTELTLKVLPRPRMTVTLAAEGLAPRAAHAAMARALGSAADVSAAAHLSCGITLLRVAGFAPSVEARCQRLPEILQDLAPLRRLDESEAAPLWAQAREAQGLVGKILWRLHLPPARASDVIAALAPWAMDWAMDWGGGLLWVAMDDEGADVRAAAAAVGGEAMLVRAPEAMRARISAFHPRPGGLAALEARVAAAFDPVGVFATERF